MRFTGDSNVNTPLVDGSDVILETRLGPSTPPPFDRKRVCVVFCARPQRKCDQYWPSDAREDYGGLAVALKSVRELAHYTRRTFGVTDTHGKKVRPAATRSVALVFSPAV